MCPLETMNLSYKVPRNDSESDRFSYVPQDNSDRNTPSSTPRHTSKNPTPPLYKRPEEEHVQ